MQGRQRGLCRYDRMRLVDSNEVIRAQKRRGVHRELFIGAGPRAGKRSAPWGWGVRMLMRSFSFYTAPWYFFFFPTWEFVNVELIHRERN